jgi:transcriptional regulator with XRE-family HTH domain
MPINSELVKKLRGERNWSQDQLAKACGLTLRTIQRVENTGKSSPDSINALASVFAISAKELVLNPASRSKSPLDIFTSGIRKCGDFTGTASRAEYRWFFRCAILLIAIAQIIHEIAYLIAAILLMLPLSAAGTRRFNDVGTSGYWQLFFLVPFGFVPVFLLLSQPGKEGLGQSSKEYPNTV